MMATQNKIITSDWTLIATGPIEFLSIEESRQVKYSPIQVVLSSAMPAADLSGHLLSSIRGIELDAGEYLYARTRATGESAMLIFTVATPSTTKVGPKLFTTPFHSPSTKRFWLTVSGCFSLTGRKIPAPKSLYAG